MGAYDVGYGVEVSKMGLFLVRLCIVGGYFERDGDIFGASPIHGEEAVLVARQFLAGKHLDG